MSDVILNYPAILVSAVAAFFIGSLWYSNMLFAKQWMKELGIVKTAMNAVQKQEMWMSMVGMFVAEVVMAYVLGHVIFYASTASAQAGEFSTMNGVQVAFWCWLGFVAAPMLALKMFERKSWAYYMITVGHYFVAMLAMGAIIGYWR